MKDAIAMLLIHARVNVEARVSKVSDLLGKKFDPLSRVAEDYRLVNLQLKPHPSMHCNTRSTSQTTKTRHLGTQAGVEWTNSPEQVSE